MSTCFPTLFCPSSRVFVSGLSLPNLSRCSVLRLQSMVSGKVKSVFGFQKTPPHPKQENPNRLSSCSSSSSSSSSHKSLPLPVPPSPPPHASPTPTKTVFSRSFGVYFPRSTQVQPRPPDVIDLVRLVDELREKESRLRTELIEQKLLKETVKIVPFLESEISSKNSEIALSEKRIESLEAENANLRREIDGLKDKIEKEGLQNEKKVKEMEDEIAELKKTLELKTRIAEKEGYLSMDVLPCSILPNRSTKNVESRDIDSIPEKQKAEITGKDEAACCSLVMIKSVAKSNAPRVPKPPPLPSFSSSSSSAGKTAKSRASLENADTAEPPELLPRVPSEGGTVPPPPPLPPTSLLKAGTAKVRRVPEVVELYHSLMRRVSRKESYAGVADAPAAASARDMIGEIENRSAYLLAIKTDVGTQGDLIRFLIKEVQNAAFSNIEDLVAFVKWLDDELSSLVDERAVLKHFDWPEQKADAMREAAFDYCDLKKLECQVSSFSDNMRQPCGPALKKMQALLERLEHGVYNLSCKREAATQRYRGLQIPWDWMLETGYVGQIKLASVKLALKFMKRVSSGLDAAGTGSEEEELMLQGVRFAFRVHQFAGGFDVETMRAFQELRNKARSCHLQFQNKQQQKFICRSTSC